MSRQLMMDPYSDPSLYDERQVYRLPQPDPCAPTLPIRRLGIVAMELKKTPLNTAARGLRVDEGDAKVSNLKKRLRDTLEAFIWMGYRHFFTSATQGVELWAAETVLDLQELYPGIALELVAPSDRHADKWQPDMRDRYLEVKARADILTIIHHEYVKGAIFARNRYLMDSCQSIITAYIPEMNSATEQFSRRARWNGKQVCELPLLIAGQAA